MRLLTIRTDVCAEDEPRTADDWAGRTDISKAPDLEQQAAPVAAENTVHRARTTQHRAWGKKRAQERYIPYSGKNAKLHVFEERLKL